MGRESKRVKAGRSRDAKWNDRELVDLAKAMQHYGSGDFKNIAEAIGTKNEGAVKYLINTSTSNARKKIVKSRPQCSTDFRRAKLLNLKFRPNVSKWRKMLFNLIDPQFRAQNYSEGTMLELIKSFFEEEQEPSNSQIVNTKEIYRYILNCFNDEIPTQLPPMESYVVKKLFEDLKQITSQCDFKEEQNWLQEYENKIVFVPMNFVNELPAETDVKRAVGKPIRVPDNLFNLLEEHKKLIQSFNPLTVPVWFLEKEGEILANKFKAG